MGTGRWQRRLLGVGLAAVIVTGMAGASSAMAADPALVERDFLCAQFDADGGVIQAPTAGKSKVLTPSGNAHLVCKNDEALSPTRAVHLDYESTGALCGIVTPEGTITTTKWKNVVTPSGISILRCHGEQ